jgi:cytochrome bd-type quinol oxidase subunit 1
MVPTGLQKALVHGQFFNHSWASNHDTNNMKKWTVGELQALRAAWRFMVGLGSLAIIVSVGLLILYLNLSPEQKNSDVHKHDVLTGIIILLVAGAIVVAGWKLRSYLKKCESETGQSSKPFGWVP